jgi:F420-0:gamma-glutamyl ligase
MEIISHRLDLLTPPRDDLLSKIKASALALKERDCIALASKVVAIHQGRCVARDPAKKDELVKQEADWYLDEPAVHGVIHTIKNGTLIANAGIDPMGGYHILWPEKPKETAEELLSWFKQEYGIQELFLIIVDSRSVMLRQGAIGIALGWAGFSPLYDNRKRKDLFGFDTGGTQTDLPDALAAAAALQMGEANEQTPLAVIRNVPFLPNQKPSPDAFEIAREDDIYAPLLKGNWKRGGGGLAL